MVTPATYVPRRGDIVRISFNPQVGKEQSGQRPAVVLSSSKYNRKIGLFIVCPITSKEKGYPFEVRLPGEMKTYGVILADQIKCFDWQSREIEHIEQAPKHIVDEIVHKINLILRD